MQLILSYPGDARSCKRFITTLLRSQTALWVRKINYAQRFTLTEEKKNIEKQQEKLLVICYEQEKQEKLEKIIATQKVVMEKVAFLE